MFGGQTVVIITIDLPCWRILCGRALRFRRRNFSASVYEMNRRPENGRTRGPSEILSSSRKRFAKYSPSPHRRALFARTFLVSFILAVDSYNDNNNNNTINSIRLLFLYTVSRSDRPDDNNRRRCYFAYALWKRASGRHTTASIVNMWRDPPSNAPRETAEFFRVINRQ